MESAKALLDPATAAAASSHLDRNHRSRPRRIVRCCGQSFWDRLGEACNVVLGVKSPKARTGSRRVAKQRSSELLVVDRGFDSDTLSQFYTQAKAAISDQVVLERNNIQEQATVDRLGELQFQFNVKRIKSAPEDEPWAVPTLIEYEPE